MKDKNKRNLSIKHNSFKKNNKSIKNINKGLKSEGFEQNITLVFLEMLITIKLFHWNTYSFAQHEASNSLYTSLNDHIDKFIEVLLGKTGNRIDFKNKDKLNLISIKGKNDMIKLIKNYKSYLVDLDRNIFLYNMSNSDLYSIRDDILADLNKFLYLLSLN